MRGRRCEFRSPHLVRVLLRRTDTLQRLPTCSDLERAKKAFVHIPYRGSKLTLALKVGLVLAL